MDKLQLAKFVLAFQGAPRPLLLCGRHKERAITRLLEEGRTAVCAPFSRTEPCAVCAIERALKLSHLKEDAMLPRHVDTIRVPITSGPTGTLRYHAAKDLGEIADGHRIILVPDPDPGTSSVYARAFPTGPMNPTFIPTEFSEWTKFPGTTKLIEAAHILLNTVHLTGRGLLITLSRF